ncbi:hypothetical protein GCM10027601_37590 [Nocardioides ungokensis]
MVVLGLVCLAACDSGASRGGTTPKSDWSPAPTRVDGLSVLAEADTDGLRLHTASGDKTFLPGINLGSSVPTRQPGELDVLTADDYRRWFGEMAGLGIRVIRVYTVHPPAFYDELAAWNRAHPQSPLYLVQGVYLPDESYVEPGRTLYSPSVDRAFTRELADAGAAVHGDLTRAPQPGRSSGTWHTDVSPWLLGWIVGVEWDPDATARTDRLERDAAYRPGTYFRATGDATATERWIARHLDGLAAAEHERGVSVPIAFVNWPTTDPLSHPQEPMRQEDLVGVDAEHVLPTRAWPGGTFASFHAYPYYPDFQRYEPGLQRTTWRGRPDPYAGYVRALRDHFTSMPLVISEMGVPSSLGSAHLGPLGRDQGSHTEQQAMQTDADLLHLVHDQGASGAFVFSWADEWFKRTWNTQDSQVDARRQLWHDPLTNEQWFGVLATDSARVPDSGHELTPASGALEYVLAEADASYLHLDVTGREATPAKASILVDSVPGEGPDYRVDVDAAAGTARVSVRRDLEPVRLYTREAIPAIERQSAWHVYRQIMNRSYEVAGKHHDAELGDVGDLVRGDWDPTSSDYDSLATWQVDDAHRTLHLRLPWSMLGLADPSSRTALGAGNPAELVRVPGIGLTFDVDGATARMDYTWPTWNHVGYSERLKAGSGVLGEAFRTLAP